MIRHLTCDLHQMQSDLTGKKRAYAPAGFVSEPFNALVIKSTNPESNDSSPHSNHATGLREAFALRDE